MLRSWKKDIEVSLAHYKAWWDHQGLVLVSSSVHPCEPRDDTPDPGPAPDAEYFYTHPEWRAQAVHYSLARREFPLDTLPIASVDTGPGSLALYMGSQPGFSWETVWFEPCLLGDRPEVYGPLKFDPETRWWKLAEEMLRLSMQWSQGRYLVGCVDLIENIDILASLRDPQTLMTDMVDRPGWVEEKVWEINQAFFESYDRVYEIIKDEYGGSTFGPFHLWGPGKTAKVQCDTCAMFSKRMMKRFVIPALTEQCRWLDHSMYHLDGHHCIQHLDLLLEIDALDAIEWTPDPQVPTGGNPCWYEMYNRILSAGKSVQAIGVQPDEIEPLLDATGGKGMYIMADLPEPHQVEKAIRIVEKFR